MVDGVNEPLSVLAGWLPGIWNVVRLVNVVPMHTRREKNGRCSRQMVNYSSSCVHDRQIGLVNSPHVWAVHVGRDCA